ncbi:hypothetical protein [Inconstantimicrobium mannanitabidum]|uniref:Uncharacterized protein n=1 Tax=Inconstantimicrobium mannanitabidum TaxID=1604901 RepID=A0ACB5RBY9_9CLOT|nr:hypothetical protein [Clostridium sp. TW13]GKX66772.1 hypothetical protein rsdtw13_20300 [Clostridium sp. TW13]
MNTVIMILIAIAAILFSLIGYSFLNIYVLRKFKPNKWIVLASAIIMFACPVVINAITKTQNLIVNLVFSIIFFILTLWFFDLYKYGQNKKNVKQKEIKIKPKAKPNRAKQSNNEKKK